MPNLKAPTVEKHIDAKHQQATNDMKPAAIQTRQAADLVALNNFAHGPAPHAALGNYRHLKPTFGQGCAQSFRRPLVAPDERAELRRDHQYRLWYPDAALTAY